MSRVYVPCCSGPVSGSGTTGGGGGGGETLAQTLALGAVTGGTDMVLSTGDRITSATSLVIEASSGQPSRIAGGANPAGPGGSATVAGGTTGGAGNDDGASVALVPTAAVGAGTDGTARVGSRSIVTRTVDLGGGASVVSSQTAGGVDGSDLRLRTLVAGAGITLTPTANEIVFAASGGGGETRPPWLVFRHTYISDQSGLRYIPMGITEVDGSNLTDRRRYIYLDGVYALNRVTVAVDFGGTANVTVGLHLNANTTALATVTQSVVTDTPTLFDFSALSADTVAGQQVAMSVTPGDRSGYQLLTTWRRV